MRPHVVVVQDFQDFVAKTANYGHRFWVFRGHGSTKWRIESSLTRFLRSHRKNIPEKVFGVREADSVQKFKRSAHHFLRHLPKEQDYLGWLSIMQHFGAHTRLVDLTYSPLVALFFAFSEAGPRITVEESVKDEDLDGKYSEYEVHGLHIHSVRAHSKQIRRSTKHPDSADYHIGTASQQKQEFVDIYEGDQLNPRQVAQQGLFLVPSKINMDIQNFLEGCPLKTDLPTSSMWVIFRFLGGRERFAKMTRSLINANLTAESLFPGLDGVARSLSMRWYQHKISVK